MKHAFTIRFIDGPAKGTHRDLMNTTRDRAAYLLRAARSRRRQNIIRTLPHLYRLLDCSCVIERDWTGRLEAPKS